MVSAYANANSNQWRGEVMKRNTGATDSYYDLLEVSPRARPEVIQAAYRALVKIQHPDHGGSDTVTAAINIAYDTLSDPAKRAEYDREQPNSTGGKIIGGVYRVIREIAEGGFGTTYVGEHILLKEPVCIKHCSNVSPLDEEILVREAKAVWNLRHFGIPTMQNLIRLEDRSLALVMSYIPGPTLTEIVKRTGPLDPEHVAWITERALNVLMYLHHHGVVHGDIKPQNIIVQPDDHLLTLVDYGLSMVKPTGGSTNSGFTPLFAPPEQEQGTTLLPESDFYALGMTMIFALSGSVELVASKQVPKNTPAPLKEFIRRLIVRDVLARPNWKKENLWETIQMVRAESFGRRHSSMKPIPGV